MKEKVNGQSQHLAAMYVGINLHHIAGSGACTSAPQIKLKNSVKLAR